MQLRRGISLFSLTLSVVLSGVMVGCHTPDVEKLAYIGNEPLRHYKDVATEIAYPTESCPAPHQVDFSRRPRQIHELTEDTVWDLSLQEAIVLALRNGKVFKQDAQIAEQGLGFSPILANPDNAPSVYDIAIIESGILFGGRGVEAALADFDARATTTMTWGRSEQVQNAPFLNLPSLSVLTEESAQFSGQIEKVFADSSSFTVQNDWNYSGNNVSSRAFPSEYSGFVRAQFRRPLLAGAGTDFTRIAGPIGDNLQGVSGVSQGVVISRINTDIAISRLEVDVATLLRDVERVYWDLHLFYYIYDAETIAARDALKYWNFIKRRPDTTQDAIAQALSTYYESLSRVEQSLADINDRETRLRRLLGLPPRDDKIIRPVDAPTGAEFAPDWRVTLAEALTRRPELRRQKWNIKSLELQLQAARSLTRPRFDFVAQYQVNGFGDQLFGQSDGASGFASAYESITQGDQTAWNIGIQVAAPFGFRLATTQVQQYEMRLRKQRAMLAEQEREIEYELHGTMQNMDRWRWSTKTNRKRRDAARQQLSVAESRLKNDERNAAAVNLLLRAHVNVRDSQVAFYRSLIEYNKAIVDLHFRKGTIFSRNNVQLTEGLWSPRAYDDALKRAWSRSYGKENNWLDTEPLEFVAGYGEIASPTPHSFTEDAQPLPEAIEGAEPAGDEGPVVEPPVDPQLEVPPVEVPPAPDQQRVPGRARVTGTNRPLPPMDAETRRMAEALRKMEGRARPR